MKLSRAIWRVTFVLTVLAAVAVLYLLFDRPPSQAKMLANFRQHRARFEELRTMIQHDRNVTTIGPDWVTAAYEDGRYLPTDVSSQRLALYRSRLKTLGFSRIDNYHGCVQLEQFGGGFTDTTWGIRYFWSPVPPSPLVASAYHQVPRRDHRHFTRIGGNWYLYHRR